MTKKNWILAVALGSSCLAVTGCVDGRDRYDPGYRRPVLVERDAPRYDRYDRRYDRDDYRDYDRRPDRSPRDFGRDTERRGDDFRPGAERRGDYERARSDRSSGRIDAERRREFCLRQPAAPICRAGNDGRS